MIGNIPYNISSPLLDWCEKNFERINDMHFMLQKEFALRCAGDEGSSSYGRLSVICNYLYEVTILKDIPRDYFDPQPKVDSLFVRFTPKVKKINRDLHKNVRKITYEAMELLQNYNWVGNVRELENTLLQAVVLANGNVVEKEHILLHSNSHIISGNDVNLSLAQIEAVHIKRVLEKVNWEKKKALEILGISKPTLNSKIKEYKIERVSNIAD